MKNTITRKPVQFRLNNSAKLQAKYMKYCYKQLKTSQYGGIRVADAAQTGELMFVGNLQHGGPVAGARRPERHARETDEGDICQDGREPRRSAVERGVH